MIISNIRRDVQLLGNDYFLKAINHSLLYKDY